MKAYRTGIQIVSITSVVQEILAQMYLLLTCINQTLNIVHIANKTPLYTCIPHHCHCPCEVVSHQEGWPGVLDLGSLSPQLSQAQMPLWRSRWQFLKTVWTPLNSALASLLVTPASTIEKKKLFYQNKTAQRK